MPQNRTKLTEMLGVEHPIMLAGMGGIAGKELVAAVANAGGFGTLGAAVNIANQGPEELRAELAELRRMCNGKPFGVDILVHGAEGGVMQQLIDVFADEGARAFISGRGFPRREVIERFHKRGMLVGSIAGRLIHAVRAVEEGVDFIIVQGTEVSVALWIP
jgi:enoyl-[acyl-carrier protein] reductase II